jgi:hypothetical protein
VDKQGWRAWLGVVVVVVVVVEVIVVRMRWW